MTDDRTDSPVGTDVWNLKTDRWREIVPEPSMCRMIRAVVIAALLVCPAAIVHGEDRPKTPSDDRVQGIFCTSPKDRGDCIEACARLKEMERYRACTAACTSLYCPRK